MNKSVEIYVSLLGENVDVWRPVLAKKIDNSVYFIIQQEYLHEVETWQFEPGDVVQCKIVQSSEGPILAAVCKA